MTTCSYDFTTTAGEKVRVEGRYAMMAWLAEHGINAIARGGLKASRARDVTETPEFKRWSNDAPLITSKAAASHSFRSGEPVVVESFHGTTNAGLEAFDKSRANVESDMGAGFYSSSSPEDVAKNYASNEGADLTNRIETIAERIEASGDFDGNHQDAVELAKKQITEGAPNTLKLYVRFENPAVIGGKGETYLDYSEEYNEDTDEYGEPTGKLVEFAEALRENAPDFNLRSRDIERFVGELFEAAEGDGVKLSKVFDMLSTESLEATDDDGNLADKELVRTSLESAGFDGIIDTTVATKFKNMGIPKGTVHYIAFKPNQLKSATGNSGAFSEAPEITKSASRPQFFSQLQRAVEQVPDRLDNMAAPMWQQWLKANAGKLGIKQDEITWSGIEDFLKMQGKAKVSKDDLVGFLDANGVRVEETVLGGSGAPYAQEIRSQNDPRIEEIDDRFHIVGDDGDSIADFDSEAEAERALDQALGGVAGETKYASYVVPGGPLARDTEILTRDGWLRMDEVQIGDEVMTRRDEDGALEWQPVEAVPTIYAEKLYHFKNQSINMRVTPCHKMVVKRRRRSSQGIFRVTAEQLWGMSECVAPLSGLWSGGEVSDLFGYDFDDVAELLGWFIAEGHAKTEKNGAKSTIGIAQCRVHNSGKCDRLEELFSRMGISWNYSGEQYWLGVKSMSSDLVQLLHAQGKSADKYVPGFMFGAPVSAINRLLDGLLLGDGCLTEGEGRKPRWVYHTKSKQLADDVQVLALLIGKRGRVSRRKTGLYEISINTKQWASIDDAKFAVVDYNDTAYCVTVKNHSIYVRTDGVAAFTGNSNYREVLVTLPERPGQVDTSGWSAQMVRAKSPVSGRPEFKVLDETGAEVATIYTSPDEADAIRVAAKGRIRKQFEKSNYTSKHWGQKNVLVHFRADDRADADGNRVLFLHDLQSDAGQDKRAGKTEFKAPFIDSTKDWVALGLKRAIMMAVEAGQDRVAVVNGEQAAEMFDLSKQVETISWADYDGGTMRSVTIDPIGGSSIEMRVDSKGMVETANAEFNGKSLDEVVGKDVANEIMSKSDGALSGEGLRIGGQGMHSFYDQIVPQVMRDVAKKMGGRVVEAEFGHSGLGNAWRDGKIIEKDLTRRQFMERYGTDNNVEFKQKRGAPGEPVEFTNPAIEITPSMRDKVLSGVPLFSRKRAFHGTPHRGIERFSTDKMGTGEGAQAFGWGLYFTDKKEIAEHYRQKLTNHNPHALVFDGKTYNGMLGADAVRFARDVAGKGGLSKAATDVLAALVMKHKGDMLAANDDISANINVAEDEPAPAKEWTELYDWIQSHDEAFNPPDGGQVYEVDIPSDDEMLHWDKPLSEQPEKVREVLANSDNPKIRGSFSFVSKLRPTQSGADGRGLYKDLGDELRGGDKAASEALLAAGVRGISYPAESLSGKTNSTDRNYVIFDGNDVEIQKTYYSRARKAQTESPEFKAWFKGSKVVDEKGEPLVVYHGTGSDIQVFDASKSERLPGVWMTPDAAAAGRYASQANQWGGAGANVMPVYVSLKNPLVFEMGKDHLGTVLAKFKADKSYDGLIVTKGGKIEAISARDGGAQIKSAIGNNGQFDPSNPDITKSAGREWQSPGMSKFDDMVYTMQDKQVDTKRVVEAIRSAKDGLAEDLDVYLQEELYHGRAAKRTEDFVSKELQPLIDEMAKAGLTVEDLDSYLHARHAKEANAVIAERNPDLQDGGSGMTNAEAQAYFDELSAADRAKLDAAAKRVDAILADTKKLYVEYELESQETIDSWGEMFKHYVPLMREDDGSGGGMGTGQGFSIKGREVKSRAGSTRKVVDILANIALQRERAIVRGEKNRVSQALVGLAQSNPNKDFWTVDVVPTTPTFNPKTGLVEQRADPMFKSRKNVVVAKVMHDDGSIKEHAVIFDERDARAMRMAAALKNLDAAQLEGLLGASAKISRYFAAVNTQWNPVFGIVNLIRDVQGALVNLQSTELAGEQKKVARATLPALRGIYADLRANRKGGTAKSEWSDLWEDFQNVGGQTGYRDQFRTSQDRAEAIKKALDPNAWMDSRLGKIFTANGALKVPMSAAMRGAKWVFDWLSDYNEAMENGIRLATYKAGLDKGMTKEKAASIAKNLTVNFNRKGQIAQQAGALYAFFNASAQGTARLGGVLFDMEPGKPKTIRLSSLGKKVVYGGMLLGTTQALALMAAGFGDDDPPEFVRERSLIIPTGGKTYITIPMPLGLHVLPTIGRVTTEWALGGFKNTPQRAIGLMTVFADSFNPIGNAGLSMQTLAPTALDPLVALTENKDFTGKPIAKESRNPATPGHALARDTATTGAKLLSEAINYVTGGNEFVAGALSPTPDQIDYLVGQVTGGVGRELSKVEQSSLAVARGEELATYKMPLVGRFIGNAASQASEGNAFFANTNRLNEIETEVKGLRSAGRSAEAQALLASKPEALLIAQANSAERAIQKLRKEKSDLIKAGAPREEVRATEEKITARMAALNRAVEALREKQAAE